jgi:malate synthase
VPEVGQFLNAEERVKAFKEMHSEVFDEYAQLLNERNALWQQADQAVRGQAASCGPWERYSETTKYDADALYEAVGRDEFLRLGGTIKTVQQRAIDRDHIKVRIEAGELRPEVVDRVRKVTGNYHAPKKLESP